MGEAGAGSLYGIAGAITLNGSGISVGAEAPNFTLDHTTQSVVIDYGSSATIGSDPNRMRKITDITLVNSDVGNTRTVRFYAETSGSGLAAITGFFTLEPLGFVKYAEGQWQVYRADGSKVEGGADGLDGTDGVDGSDGWTYAALAAPFANSTVTPTAVTDVLFAAAANTKYEVEVFGVYQAAAATTGIGLSLSCPASTVPVGFAITPVSTTAPGSMMQNTSPNPTAATASVPALNADTPIWGKWIVPVSATAGNVQLMMCSEIASSAVTLQGGRFWMKWRVLP